jgi:drug/metabolite transporter (DMT)-like permease
VTQITLAEAPVRPAGFTSTDALLGVMVLVWGVNYIVLKAVLVHIEPVALNALRFTVAATCLAVVARLRGGTPPSRQDILRFLALGVLGNTIYQFGFILGLAQTRAGNTALIMAGVPVQTAIISHLKGHDQLRPRDAIGFLVSFAGIATVVLGSATAQFGGSMVGDLLVFGATICWSFYLVGMKPMVDRFGPVQATAWAMGLGAIPLVLVSIPAALRQSWRAVPPLDYAGVLFSALGALVVAYVIWSRGIARLGPARTALYSNLTPFVVAICAWIWLGEQPTAWQGAGAAGIFTGIWLTRT